MEKWSKFFLKLIILFVLFSCTTTEKKDAKENEKNIDIAFKKAERITQGSKENMDALKEILKIDPNHSETLRELSVPYLKRGMPYEWKTLYQQAVNSEPKIWIPMRGYLYLLFYRDYEKAIDDFNASDTLTPYIDYPQGHSVDYWRGIAYLGLDDYDASIFYFDKHIKKETIDTGEDWVELEAFLYRGIAYFEQGNYQQAIVNFKKIRHYFKSSAEAKYYWAKCLISLDKKEEAKVILKEAEEDFKNEMRLTHAYVEMPYQIYISEINKLSQELEE